MLQAPTHDRKTKAEASSKTTEHLPEQEQSLPLPGWMGRFSERGAIAFGNASGTLMRQTNPLQQRENLAALQKAYGNQAVLRMRQTEKGQSPNSGSVLQRKCACGNASGAAGTCAECQQKQALPLQTKLKINKPGDQYEQEADRVADQVLAGPAHPAVSGAPPRIQRYTGHATGHADMAAPASVDHVLSSPGKPLEPSLQQDMGQRFGHDFSRVRVHSDASAAQSANDVSANAYTVGTDIVFGAGRYAPSTHAGRRLLAHELTHVVQQTQPGTAGRAQRQVQRDEFDMHKLPPKPDFFMSPNYSRRASTSTVSSIGVPQDSFIYWWSFENKPRVLPCNNCHQADEQHLFSTNMTPTEWTRVQKNPFLLWARDRVWGRCKAQRDNRYILSLLQRREDDKLNALWNSHRDAAVKTVRLGYSDDGERVFEGSNEAKQRWSNILSTEWDATVLKWVNEMATNWLVEEIAAAKRVLPGPGRLVTKPAEYAQIEDHPFDETMAIGGPYHDRAGKGFIWLGSKAVSVSTYSMDYEVMAHPRIYFNMGADEAIRTNVFVGKVLGDVAKAAEGIAVVGSFIKGVFMVVPGIAETIIDAGAKLIDMQTQLVAMIGKGTGWYHIGYSCLSSTCKRYQSGVSKSELLMDAIGDATVVVPLIKQAKQCFGDGDAEACGGLTGAALLAVYSMESPATKGIRKAMIREEIGRAPGAKAIEHADSELGAGRKAEAQEKPAAKETVRETKANEPTALGEQKKNPAKFEPVRTPEALRLEKAVHDAAKAAGSEVQIGNETHGVAASRLGEKPGFELCTRCSLLAEKLAELEEILPADSELAHHVKFARQKAAGLDSAYEKASKTNKPFTEAMEQQAARDLAAELRKSVVVDPFIELLLNMDIEDLQKNRANLKKQAAKHPILNDTQAARDARANAGDIAKRNAERAEKRKSDPPAAEPSAQAEPPKPEAPAKPTPEKQLPPGPTPKTEPAPPVPKPGLEPAKTPEAKTEPKTEPKPVKEPATKIDPRDSAREATKQKIKKIEQQKERVQVKINNLRKAIRELNEKIERLNRELQKAPAEDRPRIINEIEEANNTLNKNKGGGLREDLNGTNKEEWELGQLLKELNEALKLERPPILKPTERAIVKQAMEKGLRLDSGDSLDLADGSFKDENTKQPITDKAVIGHRYGLEERRLALEAQKRGMNQKQYQDWCNRHPEWFQIESEFENLHHGHEKPGIDNGLDWLPN